MDGTVKLITEFGILTVMSALMIVFCVMILKSFLNKYENMIEQDNERYDKLLDLVTGTHSCEEDEYINKVYDNTYSIIDKLREDTNMNRAYVFMFHNGGRSLTGIPFYKMSCISESVSLGVEHMSYQTQNILLSSFPQLFKSLHETGKLHMIDTEESKYYDQSLFSFMSSRGSKSCFIKSITNDDGRILGMLGLESLSVIDDESEVCQIEELLEESSDKLLMALLIYPKDKFLPHRYKE